jgi:hypothetical protein
MGLSPTLGGCDKASASAFLPGQTHFVAPVRPSHQPRTARLMGDLRARRGEWRAGLAAQHLVNEAGRSQLADPTQSDEAR